VASREFLALPTVHMATTTATSSYSGKGNLSLAQVRPQLEPSRKPDVNPTSGYMEQAAIVKSKNDLGWISCGERLKLQCVVQREITM